MGWRERLGWRAAPEKREAPTIVQSASYGDFMRFLGLDAAALPHVTMESALQVPAFSAAVGFLSRELAALSLHLFKDDAAGAEKIGTGLGVVLRDAANPELSSYQWREWMWGQVFTGGRGCTYIERNARGEATSLWPMDPAHTDVKRVNGRKVYSFGGKQSYDAADVIDMPWMIKSDLLGHYSPVARGARAIQLALAMNDYSAKLFANGGLPPLGLKGVMPTSPEAMKRALKDMKASVDKANEMQIPIAMMPGGYELAPLGFDPQKGQLVEGKKFVNTDIARLFGLPPVFLQDLEFGTFSNTEQQDLHLVKHVITAWCVKFEQELNLKLFGPKSAKRFVRHNIDSLLRGDFATRMEGYAKAVTHGVMTPADAREKENLPKIDGSDRLLIQGAMVPIDQAGQQQGAGGPQNAD